MATGCQVVKKRRELFCEPVDCAPHRLLRPAAALAQHQCAGKPCGTSVDVDCGSTGEVERAEPVADPTRPCHG